MEERPVPKAPDFELTTSEEDGRTVIALAGELDIATAPGFQAAAGDALAAGPVVLDLAGLTFMDSSGVRVLDSLLRAGSPLTLRPGLSEFVRQVLDMTGLLESLPFEEEDPR